MAIMLDGKAMIDRPAAHTHLAQRLDLPAYYGRNLDALYDLLSVCPEQISVTVIHTDLLLEHLGRYGKSVIRTLQDVSRDNSQITLSIFDENN